MAIVGGTPLLTPDRLDLPYVDPLIARLLPALPTRVRWELDRMRQALAALGDPQEAFQTVHVGGTNGKGSVTATVASVLAASGRRAAAYTSPHLVSFRERMVVGNEALSEASLVGYAEEARDVIVRHGLTFFEAVTLIALHAFREERVEVAAVEVGLGGRLDATNVVRPVVAAVTQVAMDHADYLGSTLPEVAAEKAGIMKAGIPFVTAETDPATLGLFRARGRDVGAPVFTLPSDAVRDVTVARDGTTFRMRTRAWGDLEVATPLAGRHQAVNTALAIEVFEHVPLALRPDERALLDGVRRVRHRGRDEVRVVDGVTWLLDVAHNPAGVASLLGTLEALDLPRPLVVLFGVLGDKDWRGMLPPLLERADAAVLTVPWTAPLDRRWDPAAAAAELGSGPRGPVSVVEGFAEAVRSAAARAAGGTVVVTGSVHTVGNAMQALGVDPLA
jgi:dihydrofolate synthase / folylpolyglutamate synthase